MKLIRLDQGQVAQIFQHVEDCFPCEAVGFFAGDVEGRVLEIVSLPNVSSNPATFIADPYAQFVAEQHFKDEGLRILGIYHSHPEGTAQLSEIDLHFAQQWSCAHVIILPHRERSDLDRMRAFVICRSAPRPLEIIIDPM